MIEQLMYLIISEKFKNSANLTTVMSIFTVYSFDTFAKIPGFCRACHICVDVRMSFCTLTLVYFSVSSVFDPVPNCTEQNPLVYRLLPISS